MTSSAVPLTSGSEGRFSRLSRMVTFDVQNTSMESGRVPRAYIDISFYVRVMCVSFVLPVKPKGIAGQLVYASTAV